MSFFDGFMLIIFILFLIFMISGLMRQTMEKHEARKNLKKDKK